MRDLVMQREDGVEARVMERDGRMYVLLAGGGGQVRLELKSGELEEFVLAVQRWLGFPNGVCPSCAVQDEQLSDAFCTRHKEEYRLSMAGELQRED